MHRLAGRQLAKKIDLAQGAVHMTKKGECKENCVSSIVFNAVILESNRTSNNSRVVFCQCLPKFEIDKQSGRQSPQGPCEGPS